MDKRFYTTVLLPTIVATGDYCWGPGEEHGTTRICEHLDAEGGHPRCTLGLDYLVYTNLGNVKKPEKCLKLKEV